MSQYAYDPYISARQSNTLGLAGFICSLVGLFTGGLLSPVGLVISLVALGKQPRGFAVAGLILGLIGTCGGIILVLFFGAMILALLGIIVLAVALSETEKIEITSDMVKIAAAVQHYKDQNHYLPAGLELLTLQESTLRDPWGEKYRYVQKDPKEDFDIVSSGEDKAFDTKDDVKLSEIEKVWAFSNNVKVSGSGSNGVVQIDLGGNTIDVVGDESGGKVKVNVGGKTIEVSGADAGGKVNVGDAPTTSQPPTPLDSASPDPG
jgi:hypothetical protein